MIYFQDKKLMACITVDIDQFLCVHRLSRSRLIFTKYDNSIDITNLDLFEFIPFELFNMTQIRYIFLDLHNSKHKLDRIPISRRINLRNINFNV